MKKTLIATCFLFSLLLMTSCQKVIDLHVRDAKQQYVIEGNITNAAGPYTVTLSQTTSFSAGYQFKGVSGAVVTVSDDAGNKEVLQESAPGIYRTASLTGVEDRTYSLIVKIQNSTFTASSTMPRKVEFDSLYIRELVDFGKAVKAVVPVFTDPVGQGNAYRFNQYKNGNLDKSLYYQNDDFTDGLPNSFALLPPDSDSTLKSNDYVVVDMQCIDKPMYKYWFSMDQSSNGNYSNIPANPVTNIVGGALGYFSAHTTQMRSITVK